MSFKYTVYMRIAIKQVYSKQYMLAKPKSDSAHISFSTHAVYLCQL